ncbi:MAG: hypothetical protein N2558_01865 [Patescibacteria group bacterium]|nr:hypothetical protein [Patescibacteria group bacterium]
MENFKLRLEFVRSETSLESRGLTCEGLRLKIEQQDIFHSLKDREIALYFLGQIKERFRNGLIDERGYNEALAALDTLVPVKDEKGRRRIANIIITSQMEQTIQSRIDSKEVDVTAPEGSWGKLPEEVKRQIARNCSLIIEMTTNCTVRCPFCAFANKGPIQEKMSFESILSVLSYFRDNQPIVPDLYEAEALYWGTDPFDAKWIVEGKELDYSDLALEYWRMMRERQSFLYTSTAIPLGEEFRVLRFADVFIRKKRESQINQFNHFRISRTNANTTRVEAIIKVLEALHGKVALEDENLLEITANRDKNVALRGKAWDKEIQRLSTWDIVGPNCRDGVVIGAKSVDGIIMEAASNEIPQGETRFPIIQEAEGVTTYSIPRHQESPDFRTSTPEEIYPDPVIVKVVFTNEGMQIQEVKVSDNPHRAFLRMVGLFRSCAIKRGGEIRHITEGDKAEFSRLLQREARLVRSYLDSGAKNKAMEMFMDFFKKHGFIDS